ncbi:MAG TPA: TonB-dependent receptor [Micropepsaceae bacterium]|nr:TonB-dependent receptor [Micropepsaceae bacterium]
MKKLGAWRRLSGLAFLPAAFFPQLAWAQTVDYGALEQLFGEHVTTSATGSPQRETDVPVNMEIVTADEIRRSGARDIPGVLRQVLGVDVMQWNSDNADVGIRGYDQTFSPRVLVLIDGRQVYADQYGYTPWAALPVELGAIRQIEVVKGPNAALFGFNAANGVINIITYNPLYDDVNTASISGGAQGTGEASAVKTFKFDGGGVRLSAGGRLDDDFSTPIPASAGSLTRKNNDRFAVDLNSVFRLGQNVQLGIEASHSAAATNDFDPTSSLANDQHYTSSLKGQLTAETNLGLLDATVYRNWTSLHYHSVSAPPVTFSDEVTVAKIQDLFKIGTDHTFRASLEYRYNTVNTATFVGGRVYYSDYAASGMWNWDITPDLSLTNAVRWENLHLGRSGAVPADYPFSNADWNRVIMEIANSTGLVWKPTDADTMRFIVSQGDQLPNLASLGALLIPTSAFNFTGNPSAEQTNIDNYEIDWDRVLPQIGGLFRASAFYLYGTDFTTLGASEVIPGPGPLPYVTSGQAGSSDARGVELSLTGTFGGNWNWGLNYRFESIRDHFVPAAQNGALFVDFEHVTPKHVVKAHLGWSQGPWEIDGYAYYQSSTRGLVAGPFTAFSFLAPVPDYLSLDARVAYRLTDWATLAISGQNLGVSPQQQTVGPKVERRVFATVTVNY